MEAHHQQTNAPVMHQQHTVIEQRNPDVSIKNRSGGGSTKSTKKRKRNQDLGPGAPRQPVNGYVRFLNERREQVRAANPSAGFADIMKIMAQEWTQLPAEEKQKYMQAAEQDRQRYQKELQEYQQTEAYKSYVQLQQQQHVQQQLHLQQQQRQAMQAAHQPQSQQQQQQAAHASHSQVQPQQYIQQIQTYNPQLHIVQHMQQPGQQQHQQQQQHGDRSNNAGGGHRTDSSGNQVGSFDIPIFTEEFLDHNKVREAELRQLRKAATEYEEQNTALRKHVETLQAAVSRLEAETEQQRRHSAALQHHLDSLRDVLANSFAHLPLPGYNETPTSQTVDSYMAHLRSMIQEGSPENAGLIAAARDIISRLNYSA